MGYKDKGKIVQFVDIYLNNGFNAKEAMRETFPDITPENLSVKTSRWIHSDDVTQCIFERIRPAGATPETMKSFVQKKLMSLIDDEGLKGNELIQALSLLSKTEGILKEHQILETKDISPEQQSLINKRLTDLGIPLE